MRVLAVARTSVPAESARPETPRDIPFEFLGLVGIADPLRPTVPAAVEQCRSAGVRVIMITGDYPQTARAIAAQANLEAGDVVTGSELEHMSDENLKQCVRSATIFARTMPEQKLRIVNALKANGEVVAMTGDGVNDAPSLKAAHIGVAMGGRGTDVAREAASLILLDYDFTSIVAAIRLGRRIYDNLRKAMAYILAVHVPIAGLALIPLLSGLPLLCSGPFTSRFSKWSSTRSARSCSKPRARRATQCAGRRAARPNRCSPPALWSRAFSRGYWSSRWSPASSSWRCARASRSPMPVRWLSRPWLRPTLASCL